jgi:hypothetical protein
MRAAILCLAFAAAAAVFGSASALHLNTSMLRSELPADSSLLAPRMKTNLGDYDPVNSKLFVYLAGAAYCDESAILDW